MDELRYEWKVYYRKKVTSEESLYYKISYREERKLIPEDILSRKETCVVQESKLVVEAISREKQLYGANQLTSQASLRWKSLISSAYK